MEYINNNNNNNNNNNIKKLYQRNPIIQSLIPKTIPNK